MRTTPASWARLRIDIPKMPGYISGKMVRTSMRIAARRDTAGLFRRGRRALLVIPQHARHRLGGLRPDAHPMLQARLIHRTPGRRARRIVIADHLQHAAGLRAPLIRDNDAMMRGFLRAAPLKPNDHHCSTSSSDPLRRPAGGGTRNGRPPPVFGTPPPASMAGGAPAWRGGGAGGGR